MIVKTSRMFGYSSIAGAGGLHPPDLGPAPRQARPPAAGDGALAPARLRPGEAGSCGLGTLPCPHAGLPQERHRYIYMYIDGNSLDIKLLFCQTATSRGPTASCWCGT